MLFYLLSLLATPLYAISTPLSSGTDISEHIPNKSSSLVSLDASFVFGLSKLWHFFDHHLDNVKFGQHVAISQCHLIAIKKFTCGKFDVLHIILINFIREGRIQIFIKFLQCFQETPLQCFISFWLEFLIYAENLQRCPFQQYLILGVLVKALSTWEGLRLQEILQSYLHLFWLHCWKFKMVGGSREPSSAGLQASFSGQQLWH